MLPNRSSQDGGYCSTINNWLREPYETQTATKGSCQGYWKTLAMGAIRTIIVKQGMPSVEQARARLQTELRSARQSGIKVLKLVHGYGSSGVGGDLRISLQSTLRQMAQKHEIGDCIYGENWRTSDERSWELLKRMPELKNDSDLGKGNKGMTLVIL
jgi:hypothetical protein